MYRTDFWTLWERARVGCFERTASKHVYYLGWNRSPAQVGCMRQVLRPGALGRPRGIGWRRRWEGGLGWGTHVTPWLIHVNVWQNPLQYCKAINLQLIKINEKIIIIINFITIIIPFYYRATLDHLLLPKILQEVLFLYLSLESILFLETSILFSTSWNSIHSLRFTSSIISFLKPPPEKVYL